MNQVQISEVVRVLRGANGNANPTYRNPCAELADRIEAHGIAPPDGIDWKELYRIQTAMRYMDANSSISTQTAFLMADTDIRSALSANAPKPEVSCER